MRDYVAAASDDVPLVFVVCIEIVFSTSCNVGLIRQIVQVGAMAHGKIDADYTDDLVSGIHFIFKKNLFSSFVCQKKSLFIMITDFSYFDVLFNHQIVAMKPFYWKPYINRMQGLN